MYQKLNDQIEVESLNLLAGSIPVTVFCNEYTTKNHRFNTYPLLEAFHYRETLIATDIKSILYGNNCSLRKNFWYYSRRKEWITIQNLKYDFLRQTICQDNLNIISDPTIARELENITNNKPKYEMKGWDVKVLEQIL